MQMDSTDSKTEDITKPSTKLTPLMEQYWSLKSLHHDKILLFRMGDFYEMFHQDAEIAAPILGITLTQRNRKSADETPMCGVPHHSITGPINKLLAAGHKVAICDQIEDPKFAKGLVKRAITRVLSPGVVYDLDTLEATQTNYMLAYDESSVAFLDLSTGEAFFYRLEAATHQQMLQRLHSLLRPVELVIHPEQKVPDFFDGIEVSRFAGDDGEGKNAKTNLAPAPAKRLLAYASAMQGTELNQFVLDFEERELMDRLELTATSLRHLEVFENSRGEKVGTLFSAIDRCKTASGQRLLRRWLQLPLAQATAIQRRLNQVEVWSQSRQDLEEIRQAFGKMGDIERRLGKVASPGCHPRDLRALSDSLLAGFQAVSTATRLAQRAPEAAALRTSQAIQQKLAGLAEQIESSLVDELPAQIKSGQFIRSGVSAELDELIALSGDSQRRILELEAREREQTGIGSLKIRFNNVFGYYIEVTNTHKDKVPTRFLRKQTLANAERFITAELEDIEQKVLTAQTKRVELELKIFEDLKRQTLALTQELMGFARDLSELDVICSGAWLALEQRYVRPQFSTQNDLILKGSRHPVVEQALKDRSFVANDIEVQAHHILLLTGPNMAGKSTLMRQVAVTALMAQIGFFVPAREATLPVFDRIFTRIGASDFLAEGLSTFMVEMQETAALLRSATPRSLVILDEVGRGTSTYDGMSLAQAILEHLAEATQAMTLFATHYHELTSLASTLGQIKNAHMSIREKNGQVFFMHTLSEGPANKSYGIHVAQLAGLPASVLRRASQILKAKETAAKTSDSPQLSLLESSALDDVNQETDFEAEAKLEMSSLDQEILGELDALSVSVTTPLEALNKISAWQQKRQNLRGQTQT